MWIQRNFATCVRGHYAQSLVSALRELAVSGYDRYLGEIDILAKFEKAWVECQVFTTSRHIVSKLQPRLKCLQTCV
jgi:hypothetical protein